MKKLTLITAMIFAIGTLTAQIIHVPADQPTIQEGINTASDGDTVLVAEDTYVENINFLGKAITVASNFIMDGDTSHISNTIIDGSQPDDPDFGSVVTFDSGEDTTSVLCGFTITGGTGTDVPGFNARSGGGIQCYPAGVKIIHNKIMNNIINADGGGYGAGILCDNNNTGWMVIRDNLIKDNTINAVNEAFGCGISAFGNAYIEYNIVEDNISNSQNDVCGGGIQCNGIFYDMNAKEIFFTNNYINNNKAYSQSSTTFGAYFGGAYIAGYFGIIQNNTITNNSVSAVGEQQCHGAGLMSVRNSVDLLVENNMIKDNFFTSGKCIGGGLCIWASGGIYQNNVIQNNKGILGGGVAIAFNNIDSLAVLMNNTITGNDGSYGGGLYLYDAYAVVINTILWNNEASEEGNEIYEVESNLEVRNSNVAGGWPGNGNMDVDPIFRNDGYHLYYPSTLVNEGTSSIFVAGDWYDCPEYDIDGDERAFEWTEPDIGADEALWYYVGVNEQSKTDLNVTVYPNPASSVVHFSISASNNIVSGSYKVTLFNTDGRIVYESMITESDFSIALSHLPSGIYYAKLYLGGFMINKKIVVNR